LGGRRRVSDEGGRGKKLWVVNPKGGTKCTVPGVKLRGGGRALGEKYKTMLFRVFGGGSSISAILVLKGAGKDALESATQGGNQPKGIV